MGKNIYFNIIKDDMKVLGKISLVSFIFTIPFYFIFKEWSLSVLCFLLLYNLFLNSSYIVSLDKRLKGKGL